MQRKVASVILLFICLVISNILYFQPAKAQYQQDITINIDGSVTPSSAPIIEKDSTYTLTDDVNGRITISKSHIIFNGNQHTIDQYSSSPNEKTEFGIVLDQVYNVTVVNTTIANTGNGIWTLNRPTAGIWIYCGGLNVIMGNNVVNNYVAIAVHQSNDNILTRNNFINNNNPYGDAPAVMFWGSTNNKICHNNFIDNENPAGTGKFNSPTTYTTWNTEKEGNYWSNYNGTDTNNDGIGDTPYIIDENNQDNYPLMEPVDIETIPEFPSWIVLPLFLITTVLIIVSKNKLTKVN
jgi:hypothetical protein